VFPGSDLGRKTKVNLHNELGVKDELEATALHTNFRGQLSIQIGRDPDDEDPQA
jgi:hypothetical protein